MSSENDISVISTPRIEWFPKCRVKRVRKISFSIGNAQGIMTGFLNIGIVSLLFRKKNFINCCKNWAFSNKEREIRIIVYSLNSTFLKAVIAIKRIIRSAKVCIIVPDLPIHMSNYKWPISFFKKRDVLRIEKLRKNVDYYCLYSLQMAKELNLKSNQFVVTEGFVDKQKINLIKKTAFTDRRICLYAGGLNPKYGIQMMIDAFANISCNCELHIYGNKEQMNNFILNENVKYMGMLSPDEVFQKMRESDLLINPRPSSLELTKYSFPSKTFEYMASGTPCVMCKLPGLPTEYLPYIYIFDDETVEGFRNKIEFILKQSNEELAEQGNKAAWFLFENKTTDNQLKKMFSLFERI